MSLRRTFAVMVWSLLVVPAWGADWPQWRGPERSGISQETGLRAEWPAEGPKLVWQVKNVDDGYSTPAVVGDRLYLISNKGMDNEFVQALDTADGKQLWATHLGKVGVNRGPQYPGSRSTPTVDGDAIYALGSDGDLACLDRATGAIRWLKNVRAVYHGEPGAWAYSESPLIDGDVLVCTPGGKDATFVALDKRTGDLLWKSALSEGDQASYASAIIVEVGGLKQYVQFVQKGLVGLDARSGKLLWRYAKTATGSPANIPTPVAADAFVYSGTNRGGGGLVQLKVGNDAVEATEVYFAPKLPTSIGGAVKVGGYLYGTNTGGLMCVDFATGEVKWQDRSVGAGSVCYAENRIYVHGEKGDLALVEATPEAYREKGRITPPDQPERGKSAAWAYPIIAGGRLYIRDLGTLWSYDVSSSAGQ